MITKGVASVRSPVCNLQQFSSIISHDTFSDAAVKSFRENYNIDQEVGDILLRLWQILNRCYSHTPSRTMMLQQMWSIFAKAWLNSQYVSITRGANLPLTTYRRVGNGRTAKRLSSIIASNIHFHGELR